MYECVCGQKMKIVQKKFKKQNKKTHFIHFCFRLDYCGIALLTIGSFVPWLYYSFYCRTEPKITYLVLIFVLGSLCIVVSMWDKFAQPQYRPLRAGMYSQEKACNQSTL